MENINLKNTDMPWVSFCMSTYKRSEFLGSQIRCILDQKFTNFEIVISDNDPEGSGRAVIELFDDPRINYEVNETNLGMVKSFNRSLSRSKAEFIVMITDDDPIYPDMLQTLYDLTIKYPGYGVYQGGCEILCYTSFAANVMRSKIGLNSCLSPNFNYDEVKTYSADEFPYHFFDGKLGALMLWSVGIVKREIAVENGGMPDYGTEYFTDHAYIVANASKEGMVYLNRSLGHQAIHGGNFGFNQLKNMEKYKATPESFISWVEKRLSHRKDWDELNKHLYDFVGRSMVEFSAFINKSLLVMDASSNEFREARKTVFRLPYLKKWRLKYLLLTKFPATFQYALELKKKLRF